MTPTLKRILAATETVTGICAANLLANNRRKEFVLARHVVWYTANTEFNLSLKSIGRQMGRDHTTIRFGVRRIERELDVEHVEAMVNAVAAALKSGRAFALGRIRWPGKDEDETLVRPAGVVGPICSDLWWASNDANFRAGIARSQMSNRVAEFTHMGKSARFLELVAPSCKSPLAVPRNLVPGLQQPTPRSDDHQGL